MKRKNAISKSKLKEALKNHSRKEICVEYNISERTLDRIICDFDLRKKNYGPKGLCEVTVSEIRNFYEIGWKQVDLARKYNVTQSLISKIINNQNHKVKTNIKISGNSEVRLEINGN
jgi:response regulator of citrate/malate metabolism